MSLNFLASSFKLAVCNYKETNQKNIKLFQSSHYNNTTGSHNNVIQLYTIFCNYVTAHTIICILVQKKKPAFTGSCLLEVFFYWAATIPTEFREMTPVTFSICVRIEWAAIALTVPVVINRSHIKFIWWHEVCWEFYFNFYFLFYFAHFSFLIL